VADARTIRLADTATALGPSYVGAVVVCGSHGGSYPGCLAARAGVRGVIFNDAGTGKDGAGCGSLAILDRLMIPAAVADYRSARIGDAADVLARGIVSMVNDAAAAIGCASGERVRDCAERMTAVEVRRVHAPTCAERRQLIGTKSDVKVWALDSASQVLPEDSGAILITGSHGGLVGGVPAAALKTRARLAVFNDAGVGADRAGIGRLKALEAQHIAAATVSAMTARIGDGLSTYEDGVISFVNGPVELRGVRPGITTRELVAVFLES
jgi:hypothetical protein